MATEVIEAPPAAAPEYIPPQFPQVQEPLKVNRGDLFEKALAKARAEEKGEAPPVEKPVDAAPTPQEPPSKDADAVQTPPEPDKKPADAPQSPLDVVTTDVKPEVKEEPDVLKEFDEKNANWKRAREVMREQSESRKALEAKIAEYEKTPKAQPEEILALAKERDELKDRYTKQEETLKALNYQYSDTFQKMVSERDSQVTKIQARVERCGGDTDKMMQALQMPDGRAKNAAIKEALTEVDSDDRQRINTLLETLDEKNEKLAEEAKNSSSRWDELQTKRNAELAEEHANGLKTIEGEFSRIASELPQTVVTMREVPDDVPDSSSWNSEIKAARETAMRVLTPGGSDQKESMEIAIKGGRYDSLEKRYLALHKDWVERGKRLTEYDSGGPDFKGSGKPTSERKLTPAEKYHQALDAGKSISTD